MFLVSITVWSQMEAMWSGRLCWDGLHLDKHDRLYEIPVEGLRETKRRREREEAEEIGGTGWGWWEGGTGIEAEVVARIGDW
jgi:hypothetical protein